MSGRQRQESRAQSTPRVGRRGGGPGGLSRPAEKPKHFKKTLIRLLKYIKPYQFLLLLVFGSAILGTLFRIISPRFLGRATTVLFDGMMAKAKGLPGAGIDFNRIGEILLFLIGLYLLSSIFRYIENYIMAGVSQKIVYDMRNDVSEKIPLLPLKYFDSHTHGETLSRVTNDMDVISGTLQQSLLQIIESLVTIVGILVMMVSISFPMTCITLVTLPLAFYATAKIAKLSQKHFIGHQRELGNINGHIEEMYGGHMVVKAFNYEEEAMERFRVINERLYQANWRSRFLSSIIMPLLSFINNIGYVLVAVVGAIFVTQGQITIGDVQAFIQYSRQFNHPIVQTSGIANILQSTIAAAERVFELLDEEEELPDAPEALQEFNPRGDISFSNVRFGYTDDNIIIPDMTINVSSGQKVAIVGPTGAGKTTLVNLLMRFYEIKGGKITVDGRDIRDIERDALRGAFGMILQDTWLFQGTIKDNITYGRNNASHDDVVQAAKTAYADHFIRTLPQGYDTVLNEEASNISAGQKQLITIARAILAVPAILILDEATSSVDTRTEILIQKAMEKLMEGKTSFIIAHRLSTIRNADVILVMDKGNIVEKGTHEELLARRGFYAEIYDSQFSESRLFPEVG